MTTFESDRQEDLYTATEEQTTFDSDIRVLLDTASVRREQILQEVQSAQSRDAQELQQLEKHLVDELDAMLLLLDQRIRECISDAQKRRQTVQDARMPVIGTVKEEVATRCAVVDDILASQARAEHEILQVCDETAANRQSALRGPGTTVWINSL